MAKLIEIDPQNKILAWTLRATIAHLFLIFMLPLLVPSLYGSAGMEYVLGDVSLYFDYASQVMAGWLPYRDYPVEYPPLAVVLFVIPRVFTSSSGLYFGLFAVQVLLFDAVTMYAIARRIASQEGLARVPLRLVWYTLFLGALYPVVATRFDLAPTAVAFVAALWWFSTRPVLGGLGMAAGTLMKIFPACIAGLGLLWEVSRTQATRPRGTMAFGVTLAIGASVWWAAGGARSLQYHAERGLQIESAPAGLLMALHLAGVTRGALGWSYSHKSYELVAGGARELAALALPAQAAALLLVLWRFWRTERTDPLRYAGAALLAFVIPGKILSPQYLIWLAPFLSVLNGRSGDRARWLFLLSCLATTFVYPWEIVRLMAFDPLMIAMLNARNAMLVALFFYLLFVAESPPAIEGVLTAVEIAREQHLAHQYVTAPPSSWQDQRMTAHSPEELPRKWPENRFCDPRRYLSPPRQTG